MTEMAQVGRFTKTSSNYIFDMGELCNCKIDPRKLFMAAPLDAGLSGCESVGETTDLPVF